MIWRIENVKQATTLSESSIARMVRAGTFPRPSFIGRRRVWNPDDVRDWVNGLFEVTEPKAPEKPSSILSRFI